nr:hypothetical protein [Tanacetum cinerariifolium]
MMLLDTKAPVWDDPLNQIQTPQYPDVHPPSKEISDEVFQANHFAQNEKSLENSSEEIAVSNPNQEKEEPPQDSDIPQLIEECSTEVCEEQKQKSNVENLLPIPSECEVTLEDEIYDDNFEDIEYVEASLSDPEIDNVEEENVVQQEEEEVDLEDISQIQDVVLRAKLLSITRLISNIESLNDNSTPDCVLNSFESNNSLSDNFSPEFETFCDHSKETRSEEADLFLASDNLIPPGIENFANDSEGDYHFLEELLIDDSILSHDSSDSKFEDNP